VRVVGFYLETTVPSLAFLRLYIQIAVSNPHFYYYFFLFFHYYYYNFNRHL
jgi:hypothetical protein